MDRAAALGNEDYEPIKQKPIDAIIKTLNAFNIKIYYDNESKFVCNKINKK